MGTPSVRVERHRGRVAVLIFDRPGRRNAWDAGMRVEVRRALGALARDDRVGAIVLTGAGSAFGAGQDLREIAAYDGVGGAGWVDDFARFFDTIRRVEKPLVAALNGPAVGSGLDVALLCDVRIGHPGVRVGIPDIDLGVPSAITAWLLREMIGTPRAIALLLTGRLIDGRRAHAEGLITELGASRRVRPRALQVARALAAKPPVATRLTRRRWRELTQPGFAEAVAAARRYQRLAFDGGEPAAIIGAHRAGRSRRSAHRPARRARHRRR
jgi:enoyl-CoA hydratase/carnithine racemase